MEVNTTEKNKETLNMYIVGVEKFNTGFGSSKICHEFVFSSISEDLDF